MLDPLLRSSEYPTRLTDLWLIDKPSESIKILSDAKLKIDQFSLNSVGSLIWKLCDGHHSVHDILTKIQIECKLKVPKNKINSDLIGFLNILNNSNLIKFDNLNDDFKDILLVAPPPPSGYSREAVQTPEYSSPPLGLCYLAEMLRSNGYKVVIKDLHQSKSNPDDILTACKKYKPLIVGITASTPSYPNAEKIARYIKAWKKDCIIIIGGPHATGAPEECVATGVFDYVCIGEGEQTIVALANAVIKKERDPHIIPGLAFFNKNRKFTINSPHSRLISLDTLPIPARDLLDLNNYINKGSIISSRGCSIGCKFCACTAISGERYRVHSINYVINEIRQMKIKYNCRHFNFNDDTFNLYPKRVLNFCNILNKTKLNIEWSCFCRASQMTQEIAMAMKNAGCKTIQFGVESGNDSILRSINKHTSIAQVENAVRMASNAGIEQIACGFIIGHANDNTQSIRDTIKFGLLLKNLGATRLTLSLLTPYPGTYIYKHMKQLGIKLLTNDWEQFTFSRVVIKTKQLNPEKLRNLYVEGIMRFLDVTKN